MKHRRVILFSCAAIVIIGTIVFLESKKTGPISSTGTADEINIEQVFEVESINEIQRDQPGTVELETVPETSEITEEAAVQEESEPEKKIISQTRADVIAGKALTYERAKEISSPDNFLNTDPITIRELVGEKVILVDFWTYTCINCQRTTPFLNSWYSKYEDDGLVILGIHTPEFEFEKELDNVTKATEALGIKYPVILDNDYSTWSAYKNRYWPRKYLIDIDGFIVYDHIGEGGYEETEKKIVEALNERSKVLGLAPVFLDTSSPDAIDEVDFSKVKTRETYLGSARNEFITNLPSKDCYGSECTYTMPESIPLHDYALGGSWVVEEENAVLKSDTGSIVSHFSANKVNLVAGGNAEVSATIYLDGELISDAFAGSDVIKGKVMFKEHTLYNLVDLRGNYGEHTVEIRFEDPDIEAFAFTFG